MPKYRKDLTAERLRELLSYDPETGLFRWRVSRGRAKAGMSTGYVNNEGYSLIGIDQRLHKAHRLAWLYVHGVWPTDQLDHINNIRHDNRIANLREATNAENGQNRVKRVDNTTSKTGVCWYIKYNCWQARITVMGKRIHLGYFAKWEDAVDARTKAKSEHHKFNPADTN